MENYCFFTKTFLFKGMDESIIRKIIDSSPPKYVKYKRTDTIDPSEIKMVGFLASGQLDVVRLRSDGTNTLLNRLEIGDSFGILSVLSEEDCSTKIYVSKNSEIFFFSQGQILAFVNSYSQVSLNLINFLANRISFLNKKIETFSGTHVENKLASFLLFEYDKIGSEMIPFNHKKCSEIINSGRASVYRALSSLESMGLIKTDNKKIIINDLKGLERMTK